MMGIFDDFTYRELVYQVTSEDLTGIMNHAQSGELTCYAGFDPTAQSLHLGNLIQILLLRRLQLAGMNVIALVGGATALVGDPSGKVAERSMLDRSTSHDYLENVSGQIENLLDTSSSTARILNNADWLESLNLVQFLREIGKHFTVNQMISKESVRQRLARPEQGISFTEFTYMLLQAYDFLQLYDAYGCRLQTGASDQWGNITMGVELIGRIRDVVAYGLTTPLLQRADGSKFGKTEEGTIWLDPSLTSPYRFYQYLVRVDDSEVVFYLKALTFLTADEIEDLREKVARRPEKREAQLALAKEVCTLVHGAHTTMQVQAASNAVYSEDIASLDDKLFAEVFFDAPHTILPRSLLDGGGYDIVDALTASGLSASKSRARVTVEQGGAYVNNHRISPSEHLIDRSMLLYDRYLLLRRGKREYHLLEFV